MSNPAVKFGFKLNESMILSLIGKESWGKRYMKRVAAGAHLPKPWLFEPAKRTDDRADYCLIGSRWGNLTTWKRRLNEGPLTTSLSLVTLVEIFTNETHGPTQTVGDFINPAHGLGPG